MMEQTVELSDGKITIVLGITFGELTVEDNEGTRFTIGINELDLVELASAIDKLLEE